MGNFRTGKLALWWDPMLSQERPQRERGTLGMGGLLSVSHWRRQATEPVSYRTWLSFLKRLDTLCGALGSSPKQSWGQQ